MLHVPSGSAAECGCSAALNRPRLFQGGQQGSARRRCAVSLHGSVSVMSTCRSTRTARTARMTACAHDASPHPLPAAPRQVGPAPDRLTSPCVQGLVGSRAGAADGDGIGHRRCRAQPEAAQAPAARGGPPKTVQTRQRCGHRRSDGRCTVRLTESGEEGRRRGENKRGGERKQVGMGGRTLRQACECLCTCASRQLVA